MLNEKELTLRVDLISNICWKGQLSEEDIIKEAFYFNYFMGKIIYLTKLTKIVERTFFRMFF